MNSDFRPAFVRLRQQGKNIGEIAKFFGVSRNTVGNAVRRFEETGSNKNRIGQGRPRSARDEENVAAAAIAITAEPSTKFNSTRKLGKKMAISQIPNYLFSGIMSNMSEPFDNVWCAYCKANGLAAYGHSKYTCPHLAQLRPCAHCGASGVDNHTKTTHSAPSRSSSALLQEQRQQQDLEELERLALADMPSSNRLILQRQSVGDLRLSHHPKVSSPIKMHNFLGNILVQSENNRVAGNVRQKAEAAAAWHQQMDRTARDEMPTSTYRISQDSFSAAIKKILMGIH